MGIGTRKMSQEDLQGKERAGKSYVWQHMWEACFPRKDKVQMRQIGPGSQRARWHSGNQYMASVNSHI